MKLAFADLTFQLSAERSLSWPRVKRGVILRGAMGSILRQVACDPLCGDPSRCRFGSECAYQTLFAPRTPDDADRLSRNQDLPRPFVVVEGDESEERIGPGGAISFTVRLFGTAVGAYPYVVLVFSELEKKGLGPRRTPVKLLSVTSRGNAVSFSNPESVEIRQLDLDLGGGDSRLECDLGVRFESPVYLKDGGREIRRGRDAFGPLARRARDRLSSLYHFYSRPGGAVAPLAWDFRAIGEEAEGVRCLRDRTEWLPNRRRSSRTGQLHDLSGLTGEAVYEKPPARLRRLLELASVTHVGKHAAFGLGRISVRRV